MDNNLTLFNPLQVDNDFIKNYRESLKQSYDAGLSQLENQRQLDHSAIVNQANKAGVLFSNIPQRMRTQYDTQTYMPALTGLQNTYQTGLDTLRNNGINAANQVAYYQQMIDHYASLPTRSSSSTSSTDQISSALQSLLGGSGSASGSSGISNSAISAGLNLVR